MSRLLSYGILEISSGLHKATLIDFAAGRSNHNDDWFLDFIKTGFHPAAWTYGGVSTIKSYAAKAGKIPVTRKTRQGYKTSFNPEDIPIAHRQFFESQRLNHIDTNNNCFVHAGFNP